jgi:hypothetical protein
LPPGTTIVVTRLARACYEPRYVLATMPAGPLAGRLAGNRHLTESRLGMSDPGQDTAALPAARPAPMSLFVVERRLPKITEQQLAVLLGG